MNGNLNQVSVDVRINPIMSMCIALLSLFPIIGCFADEPEETYTWDLNSDWQKQKLNGQVKTLAEVRYNIPINPYEEEVQPEFDMSFVYEFNKDGFIKFQSSHDEDGNVKDLDLFFYDEDGRIEKVWFDIKGKPSGGTLLFKYNKNGKLIALQSEKESGELSVKVFYKLDDKDNVVEESSWSSSGELFSKKEYIRNDKGEIIKVLSYDSYGKLKSEIDYVRDENGVIVERIKYEQESDTNERCRYEYDENGNVVKSIISDENGREQEIETSYTYDKYGNWVEKIEQHGLFSYYYKREIEYY